MYVLSHISFTRTSRHKTFFCFKVFEVLVQSNLLLFWIQSLIVNSLKCPCAPRLNQQCAYLEFREKKNRGPCKPGPHSPHVLHDPDSRCGGGKFAKSLASPNLKSQILENIVLTTKSFRSMSPFIYESLHVPAKCVISPVSEGDSFFIMYC